MITHSIIAITTPLIVLLVCTPLMIKYAQRHGYIVNPTSDRWHTKPTALLGGVAIFSGIIIGLLIVGIPTSFPAGLLLSIIIIFLAGLYDDVYTLSPFIKLIIQIGVSLIVISSGVIIGKGIIPEYIAVPLTIFWIVGITNAMNLLDNMDGLCSGVSGIIALFLGIIFLVNSQPELALISFVIFGASMGFLIYNFNPAKIFMGDSGSLLLGFMLSVLSLLGSYQTKSHMLLSLSIPLLIMILPIFDTTLVTLNRKLINRPISQGGKDHSSHRLISLGYSEKESALILYGVTSIGGSIALALNFLEIPISIMIIVVLLIAFVGSGAFLTRVKVYSKTEYESKSLNDKLAPNTTPIKTVLNNKRQIVEIVFDTLILLFSFYFAIWIQNDSDLTVTYLLQFRPFLLLIIFTLIVFYIAGFYKSIWRYLTVDDFMKYGSVIFLITLTLIAFKYVFSFDELRLSTCIIFGVLVNYLVFMFRLSERMLSTLIRRSRRPLTQSSRIIIIGAGDAANILIKNILHKTKPEMRPIGILDDDPSKIGSRIQGIPILGSIQDIKGFINKNYVDEVVITSSKVKQKTIDMIRDVTLKHDIPIKQFRIDFKEI
jgi:UDP-GlcNAc:undecaprenyl-phosphate/decaprenyl-phosphate GlcNAc-1-phosphate transferase